MMSHCASNMRKLLVFNCCTDSRGQLVVRKGKQRGVGQPSTYCRLAAGRFSPEPQIRTWSRLLGSRQTLL